MTEAGPLQEVRIAELQEGKGEGAFRLSFLQSRLSAILQLLLVSLIVSGFSRTASAQDSDLDPRIVKLVATVS